VIRHELHSAERVSLITLDRPERRNALDLAHWLELESTVRKAAGAGARAIVITGAGSTFCAGGDLNEPAVEEMAQQLENAFATIREVSIPVIAHVNGPAAGGGAQLAVSCDLRVASPAGRFGIPAAAISLPVNPGTIRRLVALAGSGAARSMLLGGDWVSADRAYTLGMVDRIGELEDALGWATEIAGFAPMLLAYFKEHLQVGNPADDAGYAARLHSILASEDHAESVRSRAERRPPRYLGR
jgi:enoyl-CoA hydratase